MVETFFTLEDLLYVKEGIYCFGLCEGEPGTREIYHRKIYRQKHGANHLAIKSTCPACGRNNTEWVRNQWSICYDCEMAFDSFERYYDLTEEYTEEEYDG